MDKENVVHIYSGILLSHNKNEMMPFVATWMQLEVIILSEISQEEKNKTMWHHLHVKSKIQHNWTYWQSRNRLTEDSLVAVEGEVEEGMDWEFGVSRCRVDGHGPTV